MDRLFSLVPKSVLAFLAIAGGILFIVISEPPHTVCDSQRDVIDKAQSKFLYKDPKSKNIKTTKYERLRDHCKATNNPGGCYEFFQELRTYAHDLGTLTQECSSAVSDTPEYRRAVWEPVEMMVRLAWGERPPVIYTAKFGWLDNADLSLFCRLKDRVIQFYGEDSWDGFREKMMRDLPGAKDLPRNQVWDLSIFSENCAKYP